MNTKAIAKLTSRLALVGVVALIYWVFIFVLMFVFEFKVFKENLTQAYYMSIVGILAVLLGAVILNVMANMTRIAEAVSSDTTRPEARPYSRAWLIAAALSFPIIVGFMVLGDARSTAAKERMLISAAETLVAENASIFDQLADYEFSKGYAETASRHVKVLSRIDENFPEVIIIHTDRVSGRDVVVGFRQWNPSSDEPEIANHVFSTSPDERRYLFSVFDGSVDEPRFSASDGSYELYYPVSTGSRPMVLYLSDRQRYGKLGS